MAERRLPAEQTEPGDLVVMIALERSAALYDRLK